LCDRWSAGYSLNSLCAQAIGAKNYHVAGEWLQLASVVVVVLCLFIIIGYFFTDDIVAYISNDTEVIERSLEFNVFSTLSLIPTALYMTIRQFFQAAHVVIPVIFVSLISIGFNVGMNQIYVHGFVTDSWIGNSSASNDVNISSTRSTQSVLDARSVAASSISGYGKIPGLSGVPGHVQPSSFASRSPLNTPGSFGFSDPNRSWPWWVH